MQQRQNDLLQQLADLKKLLTTMRKNLGVCAKPAQPSAKLELKPIQVCSSWNVYIIISIHISHHTKYILIFQTQYLQDVVINANPSQIPYSLLALQDLWQNRLNLVVKCYTHSTVAKLPEAANRFVRQLEQPPKDVSLPTLNVAFIWKDVPVVELQCAPATFIPLYGEVNILRHFTRCGPNEFGYETAVLPERSAEIDALLDACHQLTVAPAKQQRDLYKKLVQRFNSTAAVYGNEANIVDIAIFSVGQQLGALPKDAAKTASGWKKLTISRLA